VQLTKEALDILTRRSREAVNGERFLFQSEHSQSGQIIEKAGKAAFGITSQNAQNFAALKKAYAFQKSCHHSRFKANHSKLECYARRQHSND
jgi:uncharacterized SAM-dependent methyltransferase